MDKSKLEWALIGIMAGLAALLLMSETKAEEYIAVQITIGQQLDMPWYINNHWEGELPAEISVAYYNVADNGMYFTAGYSHQSNLLTGPPFNDEFENVLDQVYVGFGKKFTLK